MVRERPLPRKACGIRWRNEQTEEVRGEVRGPFSQVTEEHRVVSLASPLLTPPRSPEVFL